jgi:hypothetical protein
MIHADPVITFFVLCIGFFGYFLPAIIGWLRNHHQSMAILLLNLLLGWTVLGWIAAIVWSATATHIKET